MAQYQETIVGKPGGLVEPGVRQYGFLKKAFKKIKKGAKKVWKSPLGKIGLGALALGVPWGAGGTGGFGGMFGSKSAFGRGLGMLRNRGIMGAASKFARPAGMPAMLTRGAGGTPAGKSGMLGGAWNWMKKNPGQAAFLGGGLGLTGLSYLSGDDPEDEIVSNWWDTPESIATIRQQAKDRHSSLAFLPPA